MTPEQRDRARTIDKWLAAELPRLYHFDEHRSERNLHHVGEHPPKPSLTYEFTEAARRREALVRPMQAAAAAELEATYGVEFLQQGFADFLAFPAANPRADGFPPEYVWIAVPLITDWLVLHPADYIVETLAGRISRILSTGVDWFKRTPDESGMADVEVCVRILARYPRMPAAVEVARQVFSGAWDGPMEWPSHLPQGEDIKSAYDMHWRYLSELHVFWPALVATGADQAFFDHAMVIVKGSFPHAVLQRPADEAGTGLWQIANDFMWRLAGNLSDSGLALRTRQSCCGFYGAQWLVRGCQHADARGLRATLDGHHDPVTNAIRGLVDISGFAPAEVEAAAAELKDCSCDTLFELIPYARKGYPILLRALDQEDLSPLHELMTRISGTRFDAQYDVPNVDDPESGVVDGHQLRAAIAKAGEPLARRYMKLLERAVDHCARTIKLVQAAAGWNAPAILKGVARSDQLSLKALGVLPITHGESEILDRYQLLRKAAREITGSPERIAAVRAAAAAALSNLAITAEYPDRARLEWAMEALLSGELLASLQPTTIGDYVARLHTGGAPRLVVEKKGRELKTIPAAVRKDERYRTLKVASDELKTQTARIKRTLEEMMIYAEPLTVAQLRESVTLPFVAPLLAALVLKTNNGQFGIYDPARNELQALGGAPAYVDAPLTVAHPVDFADSAALAAWQHEVMKRGLEQPFKQVFRELYRPSRAEARSATSQRFTGQLVEPRQATRLFEARGWRTEDKTIVEPSKRFVRARIAAYFAFPEAGSAWYFDLVRATSGEIRFVRERQDPEWQWRFFAEPCPIATVPPAIFSEVMRDADLVVSVAALDRGRGWSVEATEGRAQQLRAVLDSYGVSNVVIDGTHARVAGALRDYRIHIGSGSVHLEPGGHVCTVPPGTLRVDFEHPTLAHLDDDWKTADVIATVLLFANDSKISDEELLAQIKR